MTAPGETGVLPTPDLITNRRMRFVLPGSPLLCFNEHRMREDTIVIEHAGIRCKAKMQRAPRDPLPLECGMFLWTLAMPGGIRFVTEVTLKELRTMQTVHMTAAQCFAFLGADGPLTRAGLRRES